MALRVPPILVEVNEFSIQGLPGQGVYIFIQINGKVYAAEPLAQARWTSQKGGQADIDCIQACEDTPTNLH